MEDAIPIIREKTDEFARVFGRQYPHFVEEYMLDDAEIAIVISGGHSVTCRAAINRLREQGVKIGMARLLWIRPFPSDDLRHALRGVKAVGVVETNLGLGGPTYGGILAPDVTAAMYYASSGPPSPRSWPGWAARPCPPPSSSGWPASSAQAVERGGVEKAAHWVGFEDCDDQQSTRSPLMAIEVTRQYLPLLEEGGRGDAVDDDEGRDRHYLPDMPDEDPYQAGHRTCAGCGPAIEYRWVLKAAGADTVLASPTGCMYVANSTYLCTPYTVPWAHTPIASGGSFTSGMAAGYEAMIRKGRHPGPYPNIIVMAGDGSAADIGLGSMSGALYRNHDALFICYDNECYANTGIQVSPTTPYAGLTTFTPTGKANTAGKQLPPKNLARMMAEGHPHCYVATTTVGYPVDLINKTRKGLNRRGAAFMHCYTPCQKGWVYQTSMTVELGRRVVEAGLFPVWEYDPEERTYHYFHPPVQRPVTDYLAMQGRFGHMLPEHVAATQRAANLNWQDMGMDVPAGLREGEDPQRHARLKEESYSMPLNRGVGA